MKRFLLLSLLYLPGALHAQKIVKSEVNGFTDERTIETSMVTLKHGFSTGFGVEFRAINKMLYLSLIGYGTNNTVVNEDDRLEFIFNNGSVVKFNSRVELPSNDSDIPNLFIHHYYISFDDVDVIKNNMIVLVRIVSAQSQTDIPVARKNAQELSRLGQIFLKEVNK